jgi:very-short-patch-repair endonuclease
VTEEPPHNLPLPEHLLEFARSLRHDRTNAGERLWQLLRNRRFQNLKFHREHPIPPHIVDFYCDEQRWAIEADGGQHNSPDGRAADAERTAQLVNHGITVTRFWNHEILEDFETVVEALFRAAIKLRGPT